MFDKSKIETALFGEVGFRQPYNPDYAILEPDLLTSRSGKYVTDNPYAKIEFYKDSQDYKDISDSDFNEQLRDVVRSAISDTCNAVFDSPSYIDRNLFYRYAFNPSDGVDTIPDGFIGYRIQVADKKNIAFEIKRVFLNFSPVGEDITILLFNSSINSPIESQVVTLTSEHQEVELNWVVNNSDGYYKGEFYLGYIYNSGSVSYQPIKREYNCANVLSVFTYLGIEEVKVPGHLTATLFNLEDYEGLSESTGLNFDVTVYEDFTDLIIQNSRLFADAIYYNVAISMINVYRASLRSNRNQRKSEEHIIRVIQEIEGQNEVGSVKIVGLSWKLKTELSSLKKSIEKLKKGYTGGMIKVVTMS